MLMKYENRSIYIASKPTDFRMSIDGLSRLVRQKTGGFIHDGSIYVFYNQHRDKIKCLFWDRNGFVLYYKRLDKCKFSIKAMLNDMESITGEELEQLLSGLEPISQERMPKVLEHQA